MHRASLRLLFAALNDCMQAVLGKLRAMFLHALMPFVFIFQDRRAQSTRIGNTGLAQALGLRAR